MVHQRVRILSHMEGGASYRNSFKKSKTWYSNRRALCPTWGGASFRNFGDQFGDNISCPSGKKISVHSIQYEGVKLHIEIDCKSKIWVQQ